MMTKTSLILILCITISSISILSSQSLSELEEEYGRIAGKLIEKQDYDSLLVFLDKDLSISFERDSLIAEVYHAVGLFFYGLSYYERSQKSGQKALKIKEKILPKIHKDYGRTLALLAANYLETTRLSESDSFLEETKIIWEQLLENSETVNDKEYFKNKMASYYEEKAKLSYLKGEYLLTLEFTEKSKNLYEQLGFDDDANEQIEMKGLVRSQQGAFAEAIDLQQQAIRFYTNTGEEAEPKFYLNLCYTYTQNKDYENAILYGEKGKVILKNALEEDENNKENVQYLHEVCSNLGLAYGLANQEEEADLNFQSAINYGKTLWSTSTHPHLAENYRFMAEIALQNMELELALTTIDEALSCFELQSDKNQFFIENNNIGEKQELLNCLKVRTTILGGLGETQPDRKTKYLADALTNYLQIDTLVNQIRQRFQSESARYKLFNKLQPIYEKAILAALEFYQIEGEKEFQELAYYFCSKNKALILLEDLFKNRVKKFAGIPDSLINEEAHLQTKELELSLQLNNLLTSLKEDKERILIQEKLNQVRENRKSLIRQFEQSYPQYYELKYGFQDPITVDELQQQLPKNSMLVEYFVGDHNIFIFTISKNQLRHYRVSLPQNFKENCLRFRTLSSDLNEYNDDSFQQIGHQLYRVLLEEPLANKEKGINRLIIIPNEELLLLSFDNLLTAPQSDAFLIKDYAISYAYSNQLLQGKHAKKARQEELQRFIGFGIEYDTITLNAIVRQQTDSARGLSRLEYAVEEVQTIAELLGGQAILNQDATKKAFLDYAPNASILHMAMHGVIDEQILNEAALVFSKLSDNEEYLLSSSDLYAMELNNDMAVLSACNTAYGTIQTGEGIRSLARAFSYSGCSSLVASLWLAPDRSSKDILIEFYENLDKGMAKDVALQKAKLAYLSSDEPDVYKKPMFWSHLMVFGDTAPIKKSFIWMYVLAGLLVLFVGYFLLRRRTT